MQLPALPESQIAVVDGGHLHYVDWGNSRAPALMLLHGLGSNLHAWDHFAANARARFRVVAPDQRGHGDSDWFDDYSVGTFVDDLSVLVQRSAASTFFLVGHSMGGINALAYTARYPERVNRLVIVDIGPTLAVSEVTRIAQLPPVEFASEEEVYEHMRSQDPFPPEHMVRHRARFGVKKLPSGRLAWKADQEGLRNQPQGFRKPPSREMWEMLEKLKCPTLVIRGENSLVLPKDVAERMERTIPNGRLVEIAGAGHRIPLDRPQEFEDVVLDFLA